MICAVVRNDVVENCIILSENQIPVLEEALQCELVDARPYGLRVGDLRTERGWTRNEGGEQVVLEPLEPENYESYELATVEANLQSARAERAEAVASALSQGQDEQDAALVELGGLIEETAEEHEAALVELAGAQESDNDDTNAALVELANTVAALEDKINQLTANNG